MKMAELAQPRSGFVERVQQWPRELKDYVDSLRAEMRRVTWPNKKQVQSTTIVVILTVFAFGVFFFVVDAVLSRAIVAIQNYFTK